jgi:hypothetical protein
MAQPVTPVVAQAVGSDMFVCLSAQQFVGVVLVVIARLSVNPLCKLHGTAAVPCGIMNTAGNKGGITCSVSVLDTRIAFVAVHLAGTSRHRSPLLLCFDICIKAGQSHVDRRTADIVTIFERLQPTQAPVETAGAAASAAATAAPDSSGYAKLTSAGERSEGVEGIGGCASGSIMAHDIIFLLGDLNYRLVGDKADIEALVAAGDWVALQSRDQVCHTHFGDFCTSHTAAAATNAAEARSVPAF